MKVNERKRRVTAPEVVEFETRKDTPSKDLGYWAGSAERAKERNRKTQEAVDKRKAQRCQRECPQDCADCIYEVDE